MKQHQWLAMRLSRLIVLFDDNGISIDGRTDLTVSDNITGRFDHMGGIGL